MHKNIKKLTLAISVAVAFIPMSANSFFFLPPIVTDYVKYAEEQLKTIQDQNMFYEKMNQMYGKMENMGLLKSNEVDRQNEFWVAKIANDAKKDQTIQNLEMASKSVPAFMPCGSVTNNIMFKHMKKNKENFLAKQAKKNSNMKYVVDSNDGEEITVSERLIEGLEKSIQRNPDFFNKGSPTSSKNTIANTIGRPYMANAALLMSSDEQLETLDAAQQDAMESFVLLVAPPYQSHRYREQTKSMNKKMVLDDMTESIKRNLVNQIFNKILSKKISADGELPSEIALLSINARETYLDPKNPKGTIAHKIQTSDLANPDVIQRNLAIMLATRIHSSLNEYEETLNMESMLATRLIERINN